MAPASSERIRTSLRGVGVRQVRLVCGMVLFAYLILPIPVYDTIWILLIAYVTLFMPYGMRFASGGLAQIHRELEEVAEIGGANLFQTFRRVLLPLLAPVLIACWLYVFVLCIRELAASIFLDVLNVFLFFLEIFSGGER